MKYLIFLLLMCPYLAFAQVTVTEYGASWCDNCQAERQVLPLLEHAKVQYIEINKNSPVVQRYNITAIPFIVVSNGKQEVTFIGYTNENILQAAIDNLR